MSIKMYLLLDFRRTFFKLSKIFASVLKKIKYDIVVFVSDIQFREMGFNNSIFKSISLNRETKKSILISFSVLLNESKAS